MLKTDIAVVILLGMNQLFKKVSTRAAFMLKSGESAIHELPAGTMPAATTRNLFPGARKGNPSSQRIGLPSSPSNIDIEERVTQGLQAYRHHNHFPYRNPKDPQNDINYNEASNLIKNLNSINGEKVLRPNHQLPKNFGYPNVQTIAAERKGKGILLPQHQKAMNHNPKNNPISQPNLRKNGGTGVFFPKKAAVESYKGTGVFIPQKKAAEESFKKLIHGNFFDTHQISNNHLIVESNKDFIKDKFKISGTLSSSNPHYYKANELQGTPIKPAEGSSKVDLNLNKKNHEESIEDMSEHYRNILPKNPWDQKSKL
ncbi:expressed protein [Phakopsora pachyrhizi]|uniref:Expressed protein n=1 Tax=Phakopsora pachyrhizi TaxID=170000 RepID=A0AAV0B2D3_PHAPC|nr:expressed protein [Phakopsora pachyrhizi]